MDRYFEKILACPACHSNLEWTVARERNGHSLEGSASCSTCGADYPIRDGIGVFLTPDLPRNDLWEEGSRQLSKWLRGQDDAETRLMNVPHSELGPADLFFRGLLHEEQGEFEEADRVLKLARRGLYTKDYLACSEAQFEFVIDELSTGEGPIVDLASGRCTLATDLARALARPIVATDFSPRVLRRDREWLTYHRLCGRISLLAFDARRTPFRDGSVETMTTNLGLPNIEEPGRLLEELRRIVSGRLLAISTFYPEDDAENIAVLRKYNLVDSMLRKPAMAAFAKAGWNANVRNVIRGIANPTPKGVVIEGAGIDALPVSETTLEWCVIDAR